EMPRVAFRGISSPIHDEVRPILDLAEGARNLAAQLGSYLSGAVSKRGVAVDHTSDQFREGDRLALRLTGDVAQTVHERHVGGVQVIGGGVDRGVERGRLAVDQRVGKLVLRRVVLEPGVAEAARVLRFDDAIALGMQLDVVTHTTTEGARGILYDSDIHDFSVLSPLAPPEPGGTTK